MIKILFFIETLSGGGAEKVLCNLVNNMNQSLFDITVQTVWPCIANEYLVPGIRYKSVYSVRNNFTEFLYRLEAAIGLTYQLHIKENYDIECAYLECGATKIIASSTNKKAVKLAWIHCDLKALMPKPDVFVKKTIKQYLNYDKVICVSKKGEQSFRELFGENIETNIIYNTIDCEEILQNANEEFCKVDRKDYLLIVSAGRLSTPKNYIRLLRVHKKLLDEGIKHQLLIIGEGSKRIELEQYIKVNGLEKTVQLPGFKKNPYPYLKAADLLVCSSDYECFSTFITEGLILGKAIVTTEVSGMKELLGESEYGLITDNNDDALYEGVKKMLMNSELRIYYEKKSAIRSKDFSTKRLVQDTERFFQNCLEMGR